METNFAELTKRENPNVRLNRRIRKLKLDGRQICYNKFETNWRERFTEKAPQTNEKKNDLFTRCLVGAFG